MPHIVVTHPLGPRDNLALYRLIGAMFGGDAEAERLCAEFEAASPSCPARACPPRTCST